MMSATTNKRRRASFNLDERLLEILKKRAKKSNRSLNNYIEVVLLNCADRNPNIDTLEAMYEAEHGINLIPFDRSELRAPAKRAK